MVNRTAITVPAIALAAVVLLVSGHSNAASPARRGASAAPSAADPRSGFEPAINAARQLPRLHSLLVSRGGEIVLERYFNGTRPAKLANIKSASKSVISALVGIAIDRQLIDSVETPILTWFPQLRTAGEPAKRDITIEHLLTMRSGLESTSNRNYGAWVQSRNWVDFTLNRRLLSAPGTTMDYSTGNTHLLSAILTRATRSSTWQFAQRALTRPLGFALAPWTRDPQGIYFGGNEMAMTPRQMLTFGELYLRRGRWNDTQIISPAWIDASVRPRGRSAWSGEQYGYGWWIRPLAGREAFYAWGFGGQYIFVVPSLDLVVATTSSDSVAEDRRSHRRGVFDIVEQLIVAPLADAALAR